eukprot:scaffold191914_cov32-Tisochrysis_lutea.AAC.6
MGKGRFAKVRSMKHRDTGVTYAAKIVDKAIYKGMRDIMLREVHVMRSLRHDNVIALNSALESPTSLILICQFGALARPATSCSLLTLFVCGCSRRLSICMCTCRSIGWRAVRASD